MENDSTKSVTLKRYVISVLIIWTVLISVSLAWNIVQNKSNTREIAYNLAHLTLKKDTLYRHWNADHGGVYAFVTKDTPPNPYLAHIPERDITTPSGKLLTLVNPAYMTRQVNELAQKESDTFTRVTSLKPLNPKNAPDPWETEALSAFETGAKEMATIETRGGRKVMRMMIPFTTEKACLKCHAAQGYKEGDIRGGISAMLNIEPLLSISRRYITWLSLAHLLLWFAGIGVFIQAALRLSISEQKRKQVEQEREKLIDDLRENISNIKTLQGIIPICASCKKIRNDQGYWEQVEVYVRDHTEADFSHSICEECARKLYPEIYKNR